MAYRPIEHTADLGIEVVADSLADLFSECLRGQTDCLTRLDRVEKRVHHELGLVAPELTDLLVDFLGEAIYLHETAGLVFADAKLEVGRTDRGWALSGVASGELFDLPRHGFKTLLKAVTYHEICVEQRGDGWFARVIFDI